MWVMLARERGRHMKRIVAMMLGLAVACRVEALWAQGEPPPPPSRSAEVALEVGGVVSTLLYVPIKGLLCAMTFGTAPLLYVSSGKQAVWDVTDRACEGTWIITSDILKGDKPFEFVRDNPCCGYPDE